MESWEEWLNALQNAVSQNPQIDPLAEIDKATTNDLFLRELLKNLYCSRYDIPKISSHSPGYVYLMRCEGFHGVLSPFIGRYKIGLSFNSVQRLKQLNRQQAPAPILKVSEVFVADMKSAEDLLHAQFASSRVHGEWFDFWIWELPGVFAAYKKIAARPVQEVNWLWLILSLSTLISVIIVLLAL
jgi:hypothetical protein